MDDDAVSHGTLLDGRIRYAQFRLGYRTGIEPVLLAAAIPAQSGQHIIEAGTGAGAGLLCLAARIAGIVGLGIERDPMLAQRAAQNAADNGFGDRLTFQAVAIEQLPEAETGRFDHAMANPPWHKPSGTVSPNLGRDAAKRATADTLAGWIAALSRCLKQRGSLTLIIPPANLDAAIIAGATNSMGSIRITPCWPKADREPRMLLLQFVRGGKAPTRLLPGLTLHEAGGGYTEAADTVLRKGYAIA